MTDRKRTKSEEIAYAELLAELDELKHWQQTHDLKLGSLPEQWALIARDATATPKKGRLTVSLDVDLIRFFRKFGSGYQTRMNAVLRAWMLAVQSRELETPESRDWNGGAL